jgi:hypothetical protein
VFVRTCTSLSDWVWDSSFCLISSRWRVSINDPTVPVTHVKAHYFKTLRVVLGIARCGVDVLIPGTGPVILVADKQYMPAVYTKSR